MLPQPLVDVARQHQVARGGLPQQALDLLHRLPHQAALGLLSPHHRAGHHGAGGDGDARRLGAGFVAPDAVRLQDLGRRRQRTEWPPAAVEPRQHAVAGDGLDLATGGGDGGLEVLHRHAQPLEHLVGAGLEVRVGVGTQLDAQQHRVTGLGSAEHHPHRHRLGQVARQLGDVGLHVAFLAQVGEQLVEGAGQLADLVGAVGGDPLLEVPLARGLGGFHQAPYRLQGAAGEGE